MKDLAATFEKARKAYVNGEPEESKEIFDSIIEEHPSSKEAYQSRYLRGRGFEDGFFGEADFVRALSDFQVLDDISDIYGSAGTLGVARILYREDMCSNSERIESLCKKAIALDGNVKARMLLGLLYEKVHRDHKLAARSYLSAYRRGLPWGLRYYANLKMSERRFLVACLAHAVTTITSPFLIWRYGFRSALK